MPQPVTLGNAKVADLFLQIVETDPADRSEILAAIRREFPDCAKELERLLACHEAAGTFLDTPAGIPPDEQPLRALAAGDVLDDRFLVEQFLGAGGFGEVYLALDQELGR